MNAVSPPEGSPRLVGFGVRSFRDIREPIKIGPWAKINVLGGVNNSGKSAIIDAFRKFLKLEEGFLSGSVDARSVLDVPILSGGKEAPEFEIGFCVDFSNVRAGANGFTLALNDDVHSTYLTQVLRSDLFRDTDPMSDLNSKKIWLWIAGNGDSLSTRVQRALEDLPSNREALKVATSNGFSGSVSWGGAFLWILRQVELPKKLVYVPPGRKMAPSDHRDISLKDTSGVGLPGMLLSLIAPRAEDFYRAQAKLRVINAFVGDVLGRSDAELLVPHDGATVHVAMDGKVLPLSNLGAGVEQLIMLAVVCTEYDDSLVLLEEPDLFLHPTLQRQLLRHLELNTSNTYLMTTHSAALLDTDYANVYRVDWSSSQGTECRLISTPNDRALLSTSLGFKASDLMQANAVIWIEGPSDRLYLKSWLSISDSRLLEGIHYSFVMYGGRLAEHLTALEDKNLGVVEERVVKRFFSILPINRNAVFVMDSDLLDEGGPLASYKTRIQSEFKDLGNGLTWITCGVMIENYVEVDTYLSAYREVHPRKVTSYDGGLMANPFEGGVKQPDKVAIAEVVTRISSDIPDRGELRERVHGLAKFLREVNGIVD